MNRPGAAALLFAAIFSGCATPAGSFGPRGYQQKTYGYSVGYGWPEERRFLGPDWQLDNLRVEPLTHRLVDKRGPVYVSIRQSDEDGDGAISPTEMRPEATFDLRFVNARDGAVIWIKAHPLAPGEAARDLDVLLDRYTENLSGAAVHWSADVFSAAQPTAEQFVSFLTRRGPTRVGPSLAIWGLIDLAETERLRLDPNHRSSRLEIVMSKLGYSQCHRDEKTQPGQNVQSPGLKCQQLPALLVAGYYNDVAHFDSHVGEFNRFVNQVSLPAASALPPAWQSRPVPPLPTAPRQQRLRNPSA